MKILSALWHWAALLFCLLVLFVVGGLVWSYYVGDRAPKGAPMGESIDKDEDLYTAQIIQAAIGLSMDNRAKLIDASKDPAVGRDASGNVVTSSKTAPGFQSTTYRRDVHVKSHGCVRASFQVAPVVDPQYEYGIFAQPNKKYEAIIRFSSGKPHINADGVPDARGFAMKLLNVLDGTLPDGTAGEQTQDFVMINSKVFFIRTIEEYAQFSAALGQGAAATVKYFFPSANPADWHAHEFVLANSSFKERPESLVTEQYYSLSAYKLGPRAYVKYSVRPCPANTPMRPAYASPPNVFSRLWKSAFWYVAAPAELDMDAENYHDYLRQELENQSKAGAACFDFMIQPQVANANMPVEDATVEWNEKVSPFIPVARITIEPLENNTAEMNRTCENLSFNPWQALPAHEPVGVMNRVRKALYERMGLYRRTKNCEMFCTPSCKAGVNGKTCGSGCHDACMQSCPLLQEQPVTGVSLSEKACEAVAQPTGAGGPQTTGRFDVKAAVAKGFAPDKS